MQSQVENMHCAVPGAKGETELGCTEPQHTQAYEPLRPQRLFGDFHENLNWGIRGLQSF